jgi:hypothetical protein
LLVDRVFDIPEFEPIVGNLGIEIFQKFRAE